jgi:hypothetical protein
MIYTGPCIMFGCLHIHGFARIQNIMHRAGYLNHRCIGGFMHKKPTREVSGPILWGVEEQVNNGT